MYVIDLRHWLDGRGAIALPPGRGRRLAEFVTAVVAHASDIDRPDDTPGPTCFKCLKRKSPAMRTGMTEDETIVWQCPACCTEGRVSNWQGSFWDLDSGLGTH
jgi:hypothetical protein